MNLGWLDRDRKRDVEAVNDRRSKHGWPTWGWTGLLLVAICWPLNWGLPGLRTAYLFFPLWVGYILTVDALVYRRTGTSLWARSRARFLGLFVVSAPAWWLFEWINARTNNWEYLGREAFDWLEYHALCTLSFSVVMPAVFESTEWVRSRAWMQRFASGPSITPTRSVRTGMLLGGLAMLGALLAWPRLFYPFVWTSLVFVLEPVNDWLGRPHLLEKLRLGDWREVIALSCGSLMCGFFWELWNFHSFPKWIYHTPGTEFLHVFEMPLLGYLGYVPFALELFLLKSLLWPNGPGLRDAGPS